MVDRVTFSMSTISRHLNAAGDPGVFLLVRLDGQQRGAKQDDAAVAAVRAAVPVANDAVPAKTIEGGFVASTVRGVAIQVLHDRKTRGVTETWLTALATALADSGWSGQIGISPIWAPQVDHLSGDFSYPAAFVGYRLEGYGPRAEPFIGWQVDPVTTRRITNGLQRGVLAIPEAQTWASLPHGRVPIAVTEASDFLATTVSRASGFVGLTTLLENRSAYHQVNLAGTGQCVTQSVTHEEDWQALLDAQLQSLLIEPSSVDVGMIKNIPGAANSWANADYRNRHAPVRNPIDYMANRHLWDEYVIDAAGISLLTSKHLEHAHDLSDWTIEEVAPDRHLVSARDTASWFENLAPAEEVVAKARSDFGDMILTWDTILARPGPYSSRNPNIVGR